MIGKLKINPSLLTLGLRVGIYRFGSSSLPSTLNLISSGQDNGDFMDFRFIVQHFDGDT